jgi:hypothetical protein
VIFRPTRFHHRRADAIAVAILMLPLLLAVPALVSGRAWSPAANLYGSYPWQGGVTDAGPPNPALSDVTQWFHPALVWSGSEIRQGRFPLWVPHAYTGAPFFANPQTALLFPLTWLAWLLPPAPALTLITTLKLLGAGLAMFWFLRAVLGLAVPAALIGALGFEFSTTLVGWVGWAFGSTIMFTPLLFGAVERLRQAGRWRWIVALAVIVALDLLAGYPQSAFHALLATAAWALARARGTDRWFLARCATGVVLGVGLAAAQLAPFIEYARESTVLAYRSQWMPSYAVPPAAAITLLMPYAYGSGVQSWGRWQFNILSTYVGLVPLLLAPLGAFVGRPRPAAPFFLGFALVVAATHYGAPGISAAASLPGLALGTNLRLMPLLLFAIATLGALGVDALSRGVLPIRWWPIRAWFLVLAIGGLAWVAMHQTSRGANGMVWPLWLQFAVALTGLTAAALIALRWGTGGGPLWGPLLVALQLITVVPPAFAYLPSVPARALYPETPAISWIRAQSSLGRTAMPGHVGVLYGLFEPHGYDGLTPRRIAELVGSVGTGTALVRGYAQNPLAVVGSEAVSPAAVLTSPVVDLLGVRHVMLPAGAPPLWPHLTLGYDGRDARVFVNERALPRAFLAFRARCADDRIAPRLIREHAVDLHHEVLLADCATAPSAGPPTPASADIRAYGPTRVRVATASGAPAYLVLTDTWFPGWRVRVDGRDAALWRADHAFRAVVVPAGRHEVEFRYEPRSLRMGLLVSALSVAVALALLVTGRPRGEST